MDIFDGTPYSLGVAAEDPLMKEVQDLQNQADLLREQGALNSETLLKYYGKKRFEQVAESNALEGSTLSVGETELAVSKGITLSGHDPAYVRDAQDLNKALMRLVDLSKEDAPTDIGQLQELHGLILGERKGAGIFRSVPVKISGSAHRPPQNWQTIMDQMEEWQEWSCNKNNVFAIIRASVLHAWLSHIHPFIDGNGRTARAISNLELIRMGLPPVIIRKKERARYIDALSTSDSGGDLGPFLSLMIEREGDALRGLVMAAKLEQGFNPFTAKLRKRQEQQLRIWHSSVKLLVDILEFRLEEALEGVSGKVTIKPFYDSLELDDYIDLCEGKQISKSWCFIIEVTVPALQSLKHLTWTGGRSQEMRNTISSNGGGPSLYWAVPNPMGYPPWTTKEEQNPGVVEMTLCSDQGDLWYARKKSGEISKYATHQLVEVLEKGYHDLL